MQMVIVWGNVSQIGTCLSCKVREAGALSESGSLGLGGESGKLLWMC